MTGHATMAFYTPRKTATSILWTERIGSASACGVKDRRQDNRAGPEIGD